jgi:rhodanese-related sulfurtransferase
MSQVPEAAPQQVKQAVDQGAYLIDVREPWEHDEERIPGAVLIPLGELPDRLSEVPEDRDVYVHCRMGGRSARAVELLQAAGRTRAVNVAGGLEGWREAELPLEAG